MLMVAAGSEADDSSESPAARGTSVAGATALIPILMVPDAVTSAPDWMRMAEPVVATSVLVAQMLAKLSWALFWKVRLPTPPLWPRPVLPELTSRTTGTRLLMLWTATA